MERLASTDGDGDIKYAQLFHATALKPGEDLFVGVLRLVFWGIPIKCIQQAPLRVGVAIYGKQMMQESCQGTPEKWNSLETAIQPIEERNHHTQNAVQGARRHASGNFAIDVA